MNEKQHMQQVLRKLVTGAPDDAGFLESQLLLREFAANQSGEFHSLLTFAMTGWRTEHLKVKRLEDSLKEASAQLEQVKDGAKIGALFISESGLNGQRKNGQHADGRSVVVACKGALLELPLGESLNGSELVPGNSIVFLDQQCRCVVGISHSPESCSFGSVGTVVRLLDERRIIVRFDDGGRESLVSVSSAIAAAELKPEETMLRIVDVTENLHLAVEILPQSEADERFADGLDQLPQYTREHVVGQEEAWEELERLLLRDLRLPLGRGLYGLNEGSLARNHGVFIAGPPGVGKTMLVAALLRELESAGGKKLLVKYITGSYFASKWFGESEHRALSLYSRLSALAKRRNAIPVVVIDEAGSAFVHRSRAPNEDGGSQAHADLTNTFLHILPTTDVVTIAIDNNPAAVDLAILRPGRLPLVRARRPGYRQCFEIARRNLEKTLVHRSESPRSLATTLCDLIFLGEEFRGLLKVKFTGGTQCIYEAKDLVTGADLVEGMITPAAEAALKRDEAAGAASEQDFTGITMDDLRFACVKRFATLIENINRYNASEYLDVPEGKIVQSVEKKPLHF